MEAEEELAEPTVKTEELTEITPASSEHLADLPDWLKGTTATVAPTATKEEATENTEVLPQEPTAEKPKRKPRAKKTTE